MPAALLQPGVYIEEIPSGVRAIAGVATSIALFIGWAARGPVDRAVRIANFSDYERNYSRLDRRPSLSETSPSTRTRRANGDANTASARPADWTTLRASGSRCSIMPTTMR
jgi:phage tail sheath protein FI